MKKRTKGFSGYSITSSWFDEWADIQEGETMGVHVHKIVQHKDGKPPWCEHCGLTQNHTIPVSMFERNNTTLPLDDYPLTAKRHVRNYFNDRSEETDHFKLSLDDVYIVWFSKVLQNWKALVSTTVSDGMYYEVTYNGDKGETYIDAYKKFDNVVVND